MDAYVEQYVRAWFTINKQGIKDRITFIKLMIDLVNKKIEQENN